ncbi:unnamed protein product, partial [Closterium sp. NIES-53]
DLSFNKLTGSIPDGLSTLNQLYRFDVSYNQLSGSIPAGISALTQLNFLPLRSNNLTGSIPPELSLMPSLRDIDVSCNQLTGSIPASFSDLTRMGKINVSHNQLSGPLDVVATIGVNNLYSIDLSCNQFTGSIPDTFSDLQQLGTLNVSYNQLNGSLEAIGTITALYSIDLSSNQFSGSIPNSFSSMGWLGYLYLGNNAFSGSFPTVLKSLTFLTYLTLNNNQFSGTIPSDISLSGYLEDLNLGGNQFTGPIPDGFSSLTKLTRLDLSSNQFSGSVPDGFSRLYNLQSLRLLKNQLTGSIPAGIGNMDLTFLSLSYNQFSGPIPSEIGSQKKLFALDLSSNKFSASFPASLTGLSKLQKLRLDNLEITGPIPTVIYSLTSLKELSIVNSQINGSILSAITSLSNLETLDLSRNQLSGPIPSKLGFLDRLVSLNLAFNALSDSIPSKLSWLSNLVYLDLRLNELSGPLLPATITPLKSLQELWLDRNKLTGFIPTVIGSLTNLVQLSLANNLLYGSIPDAVTLLTKLKTFDLSRNYFTGTIAKPANVLAMLSYNYLSGTLPAQPTDLLDANCFKLAEGETTPLQRSESECRAFCGVSIGSVAPLCTGHGVCYPDGPNLVPTCLCDTLQGYNLFRRVYCLVDETDLVSPVEGEILPASTVLTAGAKKEAVGMFNPDPVPLFMYEAGRVYPGCGFELAFSVNFTFALSPMGKAMSNGFAFVVSATNTVGSDVGVGYGGMDTRSMAVEFDVLQNKPQDTMKDPHVGVNIQGQEKSVAAVKSPFPLANKKPYTAWVDYVPGDPGFVRVFLATTAGKPMKPLIETRLSLCAVLKPGPPQAVPEQPRAFYFGFVASTTVKPFMIHTITSSYLRTGAPPPPATVDINPAYGLNVTLNTYVPVRASPFPRYVSADYRVSAGQKDSWVFRDLHSWDSVPFLGWPVKDQGDCNACWAYAVVSSIEAAYGIATNLEAPKLSVDSLFTAMGLTTQTAKCNAGGSPTDAFEKLMALPKGAISMEGNKKITYPVQGFERTAFKGYVGLLLAVQKQPVVVHVEATVASFAKYDGTFKYQDPGCYTGNLNHVVLVIGYFVLRDDGSENRIAPPFWIIRNSWGEAWGDRGHMRMDMQGGDGVCGINVLPGIYPIVKIPKDPCGLKSYKGDGDLQPSMNPCGRFTCMPNLKTNSNTCNCTIPDQTKQPFVEAANGYGNICVYVDVCGSYFKNPCAVGTCINDGKGAYSCICPPNYVPSRTIDNFPTCDPANMTATNMMVTGDNWQCVDVYSLAGLSSTQFTQQNTAVACNKALSKGTVLQLAESPVIPCTAFFYVLSGDTCASIASSIKLTRDDLTDLNPGLDCTQTIKPGRSICVERNGTFAYSVPQCVKYATLAAQSTCEKLLQGLGLPSTPSTWAELYRNNPGLVCSNTVPFTTSAVGSKIGVQVCLQADYWPFLLGKCTKGRPKNVSPSLTCSGAYSYYGGTMTQAASDFNTYNGNGCAGKVGAKYICVPR